VTVSASPKLGAYAALATLALVGALAAGEPELVALATPFALALVLVLGRAQVPCVAVELAVEPDRVLEGGSVVAHLAVEATAAVDRLDLALVLPPGIESERGGSLAALALGAGERRELVLPLRCSRWGAYTLGEVLIRVEDRFGFLAFEERAQGFHALRVLPQPETLRTLVRPEETQVFSGDQVSRHKGAGVEFADVRAFQHGDRMRDVNWRVSARRGRLAVTQRHPERNADVVLFLDSFAEASDGGRGTLGQAVRAASSLATHYLARHDRVGLLSFGGTVRWLMPTAGQAQLYRIVEALLETQVVLSYAWKGLDVLPAKTLPPNALVLALSPLLDERSVRALLDLRGRGFDLVVVEVSPFPFVGSPRSEDDELASRLWRLVRESLRLQFERLGVAVVEWSEGVPLTEIVEEVRAFRRYTPRRARV
jgi:uncharacterized protein (DUF58 family)